MAALALPLWDEARRLRWMAAAASIGAFVAMGEAGFELPDVVLLPIVAISFIALALRPSLPSLVVGVPSLVVPLMINVFNEGDVEFSMFLLVLGVTLLASAEPNRRIASGFPLLSMVVVFALTFTSVIDWAWANWVSAIALSWAFGAAVFHYDQLLSELRLAQAELVDQAAQVERRRIARDVHDLVGHSLSVVMLHVTGARHLLRTDLDEAETALRQAEEAGRASLAEVRRTVGLLRTDDDREGAAPVPDLSDLEPIVDQYRAAGMSVNLRRSGPIDRVQGPAAVAFHRVAQEALANVSKHARGATVTVDIDVDDGRCRLEIHNTVGESSERGRPDRAGHGLVGMRERASSVGGRLDAGPVEDGWSVRLTVPVTEVSS